MKEFKFRAYDIEKKIMIYDCDSLNEIWEKEFGNAYTDRKLKVHESEGKARESFWSDLLNRVPEIESVLEIGCNAGMNLEAIHKANPNLEITGIEPNRYALEKAVEISKGRYKVLEGNVFEIPPDLKADLIFTCTVLIHIAPDDLKSALENIYNYAGTNILIMEYYWPTTKEIEYRGLRDALWKRDYGAFFMDHFSVAIMETGYLDARDGFDRTTWWLFKKDHL